MDSRAGNTSAPQRGFENLSMRRMILLRRAKRPGQRYSGGVVLSMVEIPKESVMALSRLNLASNFRTAEGEWGRRKRKHAKAFSKPKTTRKNFL